ncbi:MAG: hypothetical protein AB8H79_03530 [Myxococcota bacterium]
MTPELYSLLSRVHGLVGFTALASLTFPIVALRVQRDLGRWTLRMAEVSVIMLLIITGLGVFLYGTYKGGVEPAFMERAPNLAHLFQSKEHLAVLALCSALGGASVLRLSDGASVSREVAWVLLFGAWLLVFLTGAAGVIVASGAHPAW